MKKTISIFLFIFLNIFTNAQDEQTNLQKYWHYRYRLVNYFMVVGDGPGMSLPADIRNINGSDQLRWGEAPVYLGYYIGVLATEYRLLKDNGQNTDQTLTELYYALKAAVRIDYSAESSWNQTNVVDGFLIRDDVPVNFVSQHLNELNINITTNQYFTFGSGKPGIVTTLGSSDYSTNLANGTPRDNAVSQDVIYPLLMGFALVKRYVDNGLLSFYNYVNSSFEQIDLRSMAINEADKIISYIKENNYGNTLNHWVIKDPDGNIVIGGNPIHVAYAL